VTPGTEFFDELNREDWQAFWDAYEAHWQPIRKKREEARKKREEAAPGTSLRDDAARK
jgi:hypothetical protein